MNIFDNHPLLIWLKYAVKLNTGQGTCLISPLLPPEAIWTVSTVSAIRIHSQTQHGAGDALNFPTAASRSDLDRIYGVGVGRVEFCIKELMFHIALMYCFGSYKHSTIDIGGKNVFTKEKNRYT